MVFREEVKPGVMFHYLQADKFKSDICGILIRDPLSRERVSVNALLAQVLLSGGLRISGPVEVQKRLEELYGAVFDVSIVKKGDEQVVFIYLETVRSGADPELFQKGIAFLSEVMAVPEGIALFSEKKVEREKAVLLEKIKSRIDNKKEYAQSRLLEEMFADEPFGIYAEGYEEDLLDIDEIWLTQEYQRLMLGAPMDVIVSGSMGQEAAREEIKKLFSMKRNHGMEEVKHTQAIAHKEVKRHTEHMEVLQAKLCMGFRIHKEPRGKELFAAMVMNELFGGSASSKLFNSVREQEGLCYYINTYIFRFKMMLFLQAGIERKQADKVVEMAQEALTRLADGEFSEEEFENAKTALVKNYSNLQDYQTAEMDFYITQYLLHAEETIAQFRKQIEKVTVEEVLAVAKGVTLDTVYLLCSREDGKEERANGA